MIFNSQHEIDELVPQVLDMVGLGDKLNNFPNELSGGEKQRVAIARAMVHRPEVIIADEPTGNLDPFHTWEIINLLQKINQLGTTVILATHDKEVVNGISKRVVTLDHGRVIRDEENGRYILSWDKFKIQTAKWKIVVFAALMVFINYNSLIFIFNFDF